LGHSGRGLEQGRRISFGEMRLLMNQPGQWARLTYFGLKIRGGNSGACEFG